MRTTPRADPAGDYAWQVFERAEKLKASSFEILSRKAPRGKGFFSPPDSRIRRLDSCGCNTGCDLHHLR